MFRLMRILIAILFLAGVGTYLWRFKQAYDASHFSGSAEEFAVVMSDRIAERARANGVDPDTYATEEATILDTIRFCLSITASEIDRASKEHNLDGYLMMSNNQKYRRCYASGDFSPRGKDFPLYVDAAFLSKQSRVTGFYIDLFLGKPAPERFLRAEFPINM